MKSIKTLLLAALAATAVADSVGKIQDGFLRAVNKKATSLQEHSPYVPYTYCARVCCDSATEETCYDENYDATLCEPIADGGCPCPEGQEKCGAFEGYAGYCTTLCCDSDTEETCYDDNYDPISCAVIADGGCPCPDGEEKCGASEGYAGYCTALLCCDSDIEETCYDDNYDPISCAVIADGGCPCPDGEEKCGASEGYAGYCTALCCDSDTEETCYDDNYDPVSCAVIADGGCPCPNGEEKCGADATIGYAGYCAMACCDSDTEETCYDENYTPSCVSIADGGCPCPEGQEKCGAFEGYAGYCTTLCCDSDTEETCYDDNYDPISCAVIADGGCPCPEGQQKCEENSFDSDNDDMTKLVEDEGTAKELAYFQELKMKQEKLSTSGGGTPMNSAGNALEQKMLAVVNTIKHREGTSVTTLIETKGSKNEIPYYHSLKMAQAKLSESGGNQMESAKIALEQKELALVRAIKRRGRFQERNPFTKNEEVSFM